MNQPTLINLRAVHLCANDISHVSLRFTLHLVQEVPIFWHLLHSFLQNPYALVQSILSE